MNSFSRYLTSGFFSLAFEPEFSSKINISPLDAICFAEEKVFAQVSFELYFLSKKRIIYCLESSSSTIFTAEKNHFLTPENFP